MVVASSTTMEYLRSLSSALGRAAGPLPAYAIGECVATCDGPVSWRVHDAVRREDGAPASVLVSPPGAPAELVHNMARSLRTLRHPAILRVLDSGEAAGATYIAVERVRPLTLDDDADWAAWGVCQIAGAVAFLGDHAGAVHARVRPESIMLTPAGEWRLAGLELLSPPGPGSVLARFGAQVPVDAYTPPEAAAAGVGWAAATPAADAYSLAKLAEAALAPHTARQLVPLLRRMRSPQPGARASAAELAAATGPGGALAANPLARAQDALREFCGAPEGQKEAALQPALHPALPPRFSAHLVVPVLAEALRVRYTGPESIAALDLSARVLLPALVARARSLDEPAWAAHVLPVLVRAFGTTFPPLRLALAAHVDELAPRVDTRTVSAAVWPALSAWLEDTVRDVRAAALTAVRAFAPRLSERTLNNELLRQLAKTQADPDPALREQTTAVIATLIPRLSATTRDTVLVPAFARALRDPVPHVRRAALAAFDSARPHFGLDTAAARALPALAPALIDRAADVRSAAFAVFDEYVAHVRSQATALPTDTYEPPAAPAEPRTLGSLWATAAEATTALGDWALGESAEAPAEAQVEAPPHAPTPAAPAAPAPAPPAPAPPAPRRASTLPTGMSLGKPPGRKLADAILRPERSASLAAADENEWGAWDEDEAPAAPSAAPTAPRKTEVERLREERRARKAQLRARRI